MKTYKVLINVPGDGSVGLEPETAEVTWRLPPPLNLEEREALRCQLADAFGSIYDMTGVSVVFENEDALPPDRDAYGFETFIPDDLPDELFD